MAQGERESPEMGLDSAVKSLVRSFQEQLQSGESPAIEDFLRVAPAADRDALFRELLKLEIGARAAAGETIAAETWKHRFPKYAAEIDQTLGFEPGPAADDTAKLAAEAMSLTADLTAPRATDVDATRPLPLAAQRPPKATDVSRQEGTKFGDYELLGEIARGGMGVVYKARQPKLNRIVAIKMILSGQLASEEDVQRFYSEAEAAAQLDHPGIVPIYEVGELDGRHYFSMGFVDGASLHDEVAKGPLAQRRAAELVRQIAEAVEYAHRHGIVHRDLKPRNILLASDGRPKVTDFGLAKRADSGVELTVSGQVLGTPAYMPPEQAAGRLSQIGPAADVYSLGGVMYFLLVARPPFQSATLAETLAQVLDAPPVSPRLLNPSVDRDLETICLKCLEKKPSHRYGSAEELADELGRFLSGEPIRARRLGPVRRAIRWIRRRPVAAALIGSIATLLIVLAVSGSAGAQFVARLRTNELERQIEERLTEAEASAEYLERVDGLLAELRPRNAAAAESFANRADQAFAEAVRRDLRRPTLDASAIAEAEGSISLLRTRDSELANALAGELDRRRRDWQPVFVVEPPFEDVADVFPPAVRTSIAVSEAGSAALRVEKRDDKPFVRALTNVASEGAVRLQAKFDESWRGAQTVGLLMKADAATGYQLAIEGLPVSAEDESAESVRQLSLDERLERDGALVAVIRRNGDPLVRRTVDAGDLAAGPLTLIAISERGTVRLQVNRLPPLSFVDPFPLPTRGAFGLLWPLGVGLLELQASRQPTPETTSPLEQGDESFERGEYAAALRQYELQQLESDDEAVRQESRFKKGMCLAELSRYDEAATVFEELLYESGDRWPPLAGARLWALRLQQHRRDEADGTFDYLSSKYDFSQFAPLIPAQIRDEIGAEYRTNLYQVSEAVRFDPDRVAEVQRVAAVDRFFSEDGRGDPMVQIDVARAFSLLGDLESAVEAAEAVALDTRHSTVLRHYVRFLRLAGDAEGARSRLDEFLRRYPGVEGRDQLLAMEKARIFAALGDWTRCEAEVDEFYRRKRTGQPVSPALMAYAALMKGELLERRGADGPAQAVRRQAYVEAAPDIERQASSMTDVLNVMILGSLSEAMDDATVHRLFAHLLRDGGDNALLRQAQALVDPGTLAKALRGMWRSPLGRPYAEAFAFETLPLRDRVKVPLCLAAVEYVNQTSMRGEMSPAQEEAAFETVGATMDGMLYDGSLQMGQIVQLALTWKGQSGFIGWGAVSPTLEPQLRAGFAYTFAHRYIALGKKDQAMKFFQIAESDSVEGSELKRLAALDRAALEKNGGFLAIRSEADEPIKLSVIIGEASAAPIEIVAQDGAEIEVPAGEATIALVDAPKGVFLDRTKVSVTPAGRAPILIRSSWARAQDGTALRGLISRPASSALGARWQIVYRDASQRPLDLAWSGDGTRFAVASDDGYIRIYPAAGTEPTAMLLAPRGLRQLRWAPSVDRILAASSELPVCGWDANDGARLFYDATRADNAAIGWRADARQFVTSAAYGGKHLRVWDAGGSLLLAPPTVQEGADFAALSPDGAYAIARVWRNGYADLQLHDLRPLTAASGQGAAPEATVASKILTGPNEGVYQSGAFSPDGKFFVAGSRSSEFSLWKIEDWTRQRISHEDHWVEDIGWSADSRTFYVLLGNAPAMIFDATADPPTLAGRIPTPGLWKGEVSPDEATVAYVDQVPKVHRVQVADGSSESFGASARSLLAVAVSSGPEPRVAISGTEWRVRLFDEQGRQIAAISAEGSRAVHALSWSPDGALLAGLTDNRRVYFWTRAGKAMGQVEVHAKLDPPTLEWKKGGAAVYVVAETGDLLEVSPSGSVQPTEDVGPPSPLTRERLRAFAESSRGVPAATTDGGALTIGRGDGKDVAPLELPNGRNAHRIAWAPDGMTLAMIDHWRQVWLATSAADPAVRVPVDERAAVWSVAWSPDSSRLATALSDGRLQVWLSEGPELLAEVSSPSESESRSVAWIDDHRLAIVGLDGVLRLAEFTGQSLSWGASTLTLPGDAWARFSPSGEPLESEGDVESGLRYVVETPAATLELLRPSEFRERVARESGIESDDVGSDAPVSPNGRPMPPTTQEILESSPAETTEVATIEDERIAESSGLALSSARPDALWTHNDSGEPELFLVDLGGKTVARVVVPQARCFDWEDCTTLTRDDKNYLLIGDVGDNFQRREETELFLIEEPNLADLAKDELEANVEAGWSLRFEDGPRDCEAIAYDSERQVLLLLTKELERECGLYEATLDFEAPGPTTARRIGSRELPAVTAMDISPDGRRLAVLASSSVWEFDRPPDANWPAAFAGAPRVYALPTAGQFEALAYGADGRSLFITAEGVRQKLLAITPATP